MKKEIFENYSKWLFDILFDCDRQIDYSNYSVEQYRTPGHLAERLLNIYISYFKDHKKLKILELPQVAIMNTEPEQNVQPAFSKNNVPIVLSADENYCPYVAAVIESILENSARVNNYDILIMNRNISENNQTRLKMVVKDSPNFRIRFIDVSRYQNKFQGIFTRGHFTIETWFRLLLPEILKNYDKVIYLDSDLVVEADIAELFETKLGDNLLAATHDADTAGLYNGFEPQKKNYMNKKISLNSPYDYFQAGVIVFNLKEFRKTYTTEELLKIAVSEKWELLDQDVLNVVAKNRVEYINMAWDVMFDLRFVRRKEIIGIAPRWLQREYEEARKTPKIIHFAGPEKPWQKPEVDFGEEFWKYARNTNFYEEVLIKNTKANNPTSRSRVDGLKNIVKKIFPHDTRRGRIIRKLFYY